MPVTVNVIRHDGSHTGKFIDLVLPLVQKSAERTRGSNDQDAPFNQESIKWQTAASLIVHRD
jgi:hypothetical protein